MKYRRIPITLVTILTILAVTVAHAQDPRIAEQERERGIVELWDALVPLQSVASFMTVGAHPDDERSSVLSLLSRGYGVRTITVTANRGEGGQNAIGTEYRRALGVLRSREMEEASLAYDVELFFLSESFSDPIYDESFSKSALETLDMWGEEVMMEKLVRAIRESRPDILFTNFQNVWGQHGHHRAMATAAEEAFVLAGDPEAFPEHLEMGLEPWQPRKFYMPAGTGGSREENPEELPATLTLPVGEYDPIYGASYRQLSEQSRAYHRSQGMGNWREEGPSESGLYLAESTVGEAATDEATIFEGLPRTVADLAAELEDEALAARFDELDAALNATLDAFPDFATVADNAALALDATRATRDALAASELDDATRADLDFRLGVKENELQLAAMHAVSLVPRLQFDDPELVPGGSAEATLSAFVGGEVPVDDVSFELVAPEGWTVAAAAQEDDANTEDGAAADAEGDATDAAGEDLAYNETVTSSWTVDVPEDAESYNPYRRHITPRGANGAVHGVVSFAVDGTPMEVEVDAGTLVAVLPELAIAASPSDLVHNLARSEAPITLNLTLTSYAGAGASTVSLDLPEGFSSEPESVDVAFDAKGDTRSASFTVIPPEDLGTGSYDVAVVAEGELASAEGVQVIEYPHVGRTYLVTPATVNLRAFEVAFDPELRIGYVASGSDLVFEGLRRIGLDVTLLSDEDVASGDLSAYDTIMVGIYGYRARPALASANDRLLDWVEQGGNMVVQYHRPWDAWDVESTPPYPLMLGSVSILARVTDQTAPVEILAPDHPVMSTPNEITQTDFEGWTKERGLYFAEDWDDAYTEVVSVTDRQWPDTAEETPFTGPMLTVDVGEGRWTYTSLSLHTQIDANVPGAYRIYANLVTPPQE